MIAYPDSPDGAHLPLGWVDGWVLLGAVRAFGIHSSEDHPKPFYVTLVAMVPFGVALLFGTFCTPSLASAAKDGDTLLSAALSRSRHNY